MNVSILTIGTELTVGQIINKNSQWISQKIYQWGFNLSCHLTVPDERKQILDGLDYCSRHSEILFVTGGLGPTTDDFTRDMIAQWCDLPMQFDEASWQSIRNRLTERDVTIRDSQKQQCYFPKGSKIIKNDAGTANAFSLSGNGLNRIFVLPGPPREVAAVWNEIESELKPLADRLDSLITKSWDTLGQGESEIAQLVENAIADCPFEIGYRAHLPFVEVKLTFLKSQESKAKKYCDAVEKSLQAWTVLRNGEDAARNFGSHLAKLGTVSIVDEVSGSYLIQRLLPFCGDSLAAHRFVFAQNLGGGVSSEHQFRLFFDKGNSTAAIITYLNQKSGQIQAQTLNSPAFYQAPLLQDRARQYFAELALFHWSLLAQS